MDEVREQTCRNCRFWDKFARSSVEGECRRHAPKFKGRKIEARWPVTFDSSWCGQWEEWKKTI